MTEIYRADTESLNIALKNAQDELKTKNILPIFCEKIIKRINSKPLNYLTFGPYWWAIKKILNDNGIFLGQETNQIYVNLYTLSTPEITLLAAWNFADINRENFIYGTREFMLDDDNNTFISLFDADMEAMQ